MAQAKIRPQEGCTAVKLGTIDTVDLYIYWECIGQPLELIPFGHLGQVLTCADCARSVRRTGATSKPKKGRKGL